MDLEEDKIQKIKGELAETGKSVFILKAELKDKNGLIVATTKGTY